MVLQQKSNVVLHTKSSKEILECINAQRKYCKATGLPHFAPDNGICWSCHRNIYQLYGHKGRDWELIDGEVYDYITGYTNEEAGTKLITGCPHCNRTYCD